MDGLKHSFIGTLANARLSHQRANESQIDLNAYALWRFSQPMPVSKDALNPAKIKVPPATDVDRVQ